MRSQNPGVCLSEREYQSVPVVTRTQGDSQQVTSPHPASLEASGARPLLEKGTGQLVPQLHRKGIPSLAHTGPVTLPAPGGLFSPPHSISDFQLFQNLSVFPARWSHLQAPHPMELGREAAGGTHLRSLCWRRALAQDSDSSSRSGMESTSSQIASMTSRSPSCIGWPCSGRGVILAGGWLLLE